MNAKGALIAASVAGLFTTGAPLIASADKAASDVKCEGINSCKGKGACSQAKHECAGMNACKGQGWIKASAEDCKKQKGKVVAEK
jgi:hypothetical protein